MSRLIGAAFSRGIRYLGFLIFIIALLLSVDLLRQEWVGLQERIARLEQWKEGAEQDRRRVQEAEREIETEKRRWRNNQEHEAAPYRRALREIDEQIARVGEQLSMFQEEYANLRALAEKSRLEANEARAKMEALERESWITDKYFKPERYAELLLARELYALADSAASTAETRRDEKQEEIENSPDHELLLEKQRIIDRIDEIVSTESPKLRELTESLVAARQTFDDSIAKIIVEEEWLQKNPMQRATLAIKGKLPLALGILVGVILTPLAIKTVFYFFLAPMATQLPPIRIIPAVSIPTRPTFSGSDKSMEIQVDSTEELLVHPDFVGVAKLAAHKRTQWLLNNRLPLSSVAAGMYALLRISSDDPVGTRVALACISDPLAEIGIVELPTGAAMVIQPRSLAGVITAKGMPVKITRHWRFKSAHAWLTLQLRYLVFHGPCRLILKGCNGIRMEMPDASQPSLISQAKTIGFSANLDYKTVRTAVFFPYLQGKADLFNDMFIGEEGSFVYEVLPNAGRRAGVTGRGLEGVADAVLKVFGI